MSVANPVKVIRTGALILMVPVAAELVYYTYNSFFHAYRFCFGEPDRWNTHWQVDAGTAIEMGPRLGYFLFWSMIILASVAAFVVGLYVLNRCRKGLVFDAQTARGVHLLGAVLMFAMAIDQVFKAMDTYLITRFNIAGPEAIRWFYDPSDVKTFLLAVILFLFGWVMRKGIEVDRENRGFV